MGKLARWVKCKSTRKYACIEANQLETLTDLGEGMRVASGDQVHTGSLGSR